MPELPDLEVLKEILERWLVERKITDVRVLRPGILNFSKLKKGGDS
jgi:formamidopyrimidine-DNA glycosylase